VPEPKVIKNRMHVDLKAVDSTMDVEVTRLEAAGGRVVRIVEDTPGIRTNVIMADPEGNEFCVCS
jgi:predicted enzyme related to lactoylglutathione lyase